MRERLAPLIPVGVFLILLVIPRSASAYPWMIRHAYTQCATCHTDPSGSGLLTPYGRAQSELLLSARWGGNNEEEASRASDFGFGLFPLPEALDLQGWSRQGFIWNFTDGESVDRRLLFMRADVGAHLRISRWRASATVGIALNQGRAQSQEAWVTAASGAEAANLVSREHWLGVDLLEGAALLRAGRINLPFGLRNLEHSSFVRQATRTDINQNQQHGVAFAWNGDRIRAEAMIVLGNFQLGPDVYRERGLSAYTEVAITPRLAAGASSFVTRAARDDRGTDVYRQAHGLFVRWATPWRLLVLMGEADALLDTRRRSSTSFGWVAHAQADVEVLRGLHVFVTGEMLDASVEVDGSSRGAWLSAAFFPVPHLDLRIDVLRRWAHETAASDTILLQLHGYL